MIKGQLPENFVRVPGISYAGCLFPNPASKVALCTLWSDPLRARNLDHYYMVGNCVSPAGVEMVLRTLRANPQITRLVVEGRDATKTRVLLRLAVPGESYYYAFQTEPDTFTLALARESVVDPMPPPPKPETLTDRGHPAQRIVAPNLWKAWPRLLAQVMAHGAVGGTSYGYQQRELLSPAWVFHAGETLELPVPAWFEGLEGFGKDRAGLDDYATTSMLNPSEDPEVTYTYGHRLRGRWDDQVERVIKLLTPRPQRPDEADEDYAAVVDRAVNQRRGTLSTWDPGSRTVDLAAEWDSQDVIKPSDIAGTHPPCFTNAWFRRDSDDTLYCHAVFRSHDLFRAAVENAWGVCRLMEYIADRLPWCKGPGTLVITSQSGHIYQDCWERAEAVAKARGRGTFVPDPRANLRVRRERTPGGFTATIIVDLLGPTGAPVDHVEAATADKAITKVLQKGWVTEVSHAAWLGKRCVEVTR